MFCHLHTHSCYSFLEGIPTPTKLAQAAADRGMDTLALTDHSSLTGTVAFYQSCKKIGVRPILGCEVNLQRPAQSSFQTPGDYFGRLVFLAMDLEGWRNLCRISSAVNTAQGSAEAIQCTLQQLEQYNQGLLCLTGGYIGPINQLLQFPDCDKEIKTLLYSLKNIFPGRLYLEINRLAARDERDNHLLKILAAESHLPLVAAQPVFYLQPEQAALHKTVNAIRQITPINSLKKEHYAPPGAYFVSSQEMESWFAHYPEAIASVRDISERCQVELELGKQNYPQITLPPGATPSELLRQRAFAGVEKYYPNPSPQVISRLEHELEVIAARGYEPIFLIAEEMISFARNRGIPTASRGSASSSLVAHCMGITTPDPLDLDLFFERFLNPARATPPDIDTDFCSRRREEVIHHLFQTFGEDRVAMVGTITTYRSRSALGEVAKAHGLPPSEIRALTSKLSYRFYGTGASSEDGQETEQSPFADLIAQHKNDTRFSEIFTQSEAILGMPHHLSVHPGGLVIAPGPIVDYVPVTRSGGKGVIITQFDLDDVEQAGLVKLDLLGIRGLTVLGDVAECIHSWRRKEFRNPSEVLEAIPQQDPETSAILCAGRTIGCFQIESPGMRATLKDIQAKSPSDLMAALALYRPGPLKGGLRDAFVRRFKREEVVTHIHPALSSLLQDTFGVILYQEQVLRIAHELAGLSLAEADLLRRAMSHFDPGKQMQILKEKFIAGAEQRRNIQPEIGQRIWEMMAAFAGYGFPKAHAASYAQVAWRSAWCKAHYPAEFLAAVLANWGGYYPQSVYRNEARRLKIPVFPPHINHSRHQFSVSYPQGEPVLYMGLDQVRDLTHRTQEKAIRYRPYNSLTEFVMKVDPRKVELENLVQVGAFEGIGQIPILLAEIESSISKPGQLSLFEANNQNGEDWSLAQKMDAQQQILGASLVGHPLELYAAEVQSAGVISTIEAATRTGEIVRVAGLRQTLYRSRTVKNEPMGFLTLEDLEGMIDIVFLPEFYRRVKNILTSEPIPFIVEGQIDRDANTGDPVMIAQKISRLKEKIRSS